MRARRRHAPQPRRSARARGRWEVQRHLPRSNRPDAVRSMRDRRWPRSQRSSWPIRRRDRRQRARRASVAIDNQHMPIAGAARPALDWRAHRNGVSAGIALVGIIEGDRDARRVTRHDDVRNAKWSASIACTEIGMQSFGHTDARNERIGIGIDTRRVHRRVPGIVRGKWTLPLEARINTETWRPGTARRGGNGGGVLGAARREG